MVLASNCGVSYYRSVLCQEKKPPALSTNAGILCEARKGYYENKRHLTDMRGSDSGPVSAICSRRTIQRFARSRASPNSASTVCLGIFVHVIDRLVRYFRFLHRIAVGLSVKPHENQEDYSPYTMLAPGNIHRPGGPDGYSRNALVDCSTLPLFLRWQLDCQRPRYYRWQAHLHGFVRHHSQSQIGLWQVFQLTWRGLWVASLQL